MVDADQARPRKRWWVAGLATAVGVATVLMMAGYLGLLGSPQDIALSDRLSQIQIETVASPQGEQLVVKVRQGTQQVALSPGQFIEQVRQRQLQSNTGGLLYRVFDITSWTGLLWVTFGFAGQMLFTGRMLVQWIVSEKHKRSVVPVAFWWMSLIGATMLMLYFLWRVEPVGLLGQSTGWFVYVRNLWLIYGRPRDQVVTAEQDPSPEPLVEAEVATEPVKG